MEQTQTLEIINLSLEKVIETKLVQNNITEQVLTALKEKYGSLRLKAVDDKESYLELKQAAKECAKVRTLTTKVCKDGREDAIKIQKGWIAEEKRVLLRVAEVESVLDAEIKKFDDEVQRKANEVKQRQEEAYINRQATLTRMGAVYSFGYFTLGEASFEANLVKDSSEDVWSEAIVPKFRAEYEKIEAVKVEQERQRAEREAEMKRQQDEFRHQQEAFKQQQAEMQRQKDEAERIDAEKRSQLQNKRLHLLLPHNPYSQANVPVNALWSLSEEDFTTLFAQVKEANDKAEADRKQKIEEEATKREQARIVEENRLAEIKRQQDEQKKKAELDAAGDKTKWNEFVKKLNDLEFYEMKSGLYRNKMATAKNHIMEILSL